MEEEETLVSKVLPVLIALSMIAAPAIIFAV